MTSLRLKGRAMADQDDLSGGHDVLVITGAGQNTSRAVMAATVANAAMCAS